MKRPLKTFVAVVCAALTLTFASCTKDAEDLIIGSWQGIEELVNEQGSDETEVYVFDETQEVIWTFNKDLTFTMMNKWVDEEHGRSETLNQNGTYSVKDNKLTITATYGNESDTYTLDIDYIDKEGMMLSMTETDGSYGYTMKIRFRRI